MIAGGAGLLPVVVTFRIGGRQLQGETTQIDPNGMFIVTEAPAKRDAFIELDVPLRDAQGRVAVQKCTATVRWVAQDVGRAPPNGFYAEIMSFRNPRGRGIYEDYVRRANA